MIRSPRSTQETTLLIFSGTVSIGIGLFFIIRLVSGEIVLAVHNGGIAITAFCVFLWVYKTRETEVAGIIIASACVSGATIIVYLAGVEHFYWAYPSFIAPFFACRPRVATLLSGIGLTFLLPAFWLAADTLVFVRGLVALSANLMFGVTFMVLSHRHKAQLEHVVKTDAMTGANNRRALDEYLLQLVKPDSRQGRDASILMMDIDHFKPVNDFLGHLEGDKVLSKFADVVRKNIDPKDQFFRYGGEEFTVITPMANGAAMALAETLRAAIEEAKLVSHQPVTVSIGVTSLNEYDSGDTALMRADMALLAAKDQGRNRVILAKS